MTRVLNYLFIKVRFALNCFCHLREQTPPPQKPKKLGCNMGRANNCGGVKKSFHDPTAISQLGFFKNEQSFSSESVSVVVKTADCSQAVRSHSRRNPISFSYHFGVQTAIRLPEWWNPQFSQLRTQLVYFVETRVFLFQEKFAPYDFCLGVGSLGSSTWYDQPEREIPIQKIRRAWKNQTARFSRTAQNRKPHCVETRVPLVDRLSQILPRQGNDASVLGQFLQYNWSKQLIEFKRESIQLRFFFLKTRSLLSQQREHTKQTVAFQITEYR